MSDPADRDTAELLDDLEATLEALREEVDGRERRPRPPTPLELLRFTERHTIPTLVATLEATVEALELVREFLRLVDPERSSGRAGDAAGDRLGRAGDAAVASTERLLADLRRALAAEDLPDDEAARPLVAEARELSEEVEARLREARERSSDGRSPSDGGDGPVRIDVAPEDEDSTVEGNEVSEESEEGEGGEEQADDVGVDVDAELESIRDEVRGDQDETQ